MIKWHLVFLVVICPRRNEKAMVARWIRANAFVSIFPQKHTWMKYAAMRYSFTHAVPLLSVSRTFLYDDVDIRVVTPGTRFAALGIRPAAAMFNSNMSENSSIDD